MADRVKSKRQLIHFGDMRLGVDSNRSRRTPTVRKPKGALEPVDRFKVPPGGRPRVETGNAAVADLGTSSVVAPTLAERAALDRIDLSVDLAPVRGLLLEFDRASGRDFAALTTALVGKKLLRLRKLLVGH